MQTHRNALQHAATWDLAVFKQICRTKGIKKRKRERERECVCVCVHVCARHIRSKMETLFCRIKVWQREDGGVCVCVCVCVRVHACCRYTCPRTLKTRFCRIAVALLLRGSANGWCGLWRVDQFIFPTPCFHCSFTELLKVVLLVIKRLLTWESVP